MEGTMGLRPLMSSVRTLGVCFVAGGMLVACSTGDSSTADTAEDDRQEITEAATATDSSECLADSLATTADEYRTLSETDGNMTLEASPELIEKLPDAMVACSDAAVMAALYASELRSSAGEALDPDVQSCIVDNSESETAALLRVMFGSKRGDTPIERIEEVAPLLATCTSASWWLGGGLTDASEAEVACIDSSLDDDEREELIVLALARAEAFTDATSAALYDCTDFVEAMFGPDVDALDLAPGSRACLNGVAEEFDVLYPLADDQLPAYQDAVTQCFTDEELAAVTELLSSG